MQGPLTTGYGLSAFVYSLINYQPNQCRKRPSKESDSCCAGKKFTNRLLPHT
jgi:hypothetical protein